VPRSELLKKNEINMGQTMLNYKGVAYQFDNKIREICV